MKTTPNIDMSEVTRLTRSGRLSEAMALLRGTPVQSPNVSGPTREIEMSPPSRPGEAWTAAKAPFKQNDRPEFVGFRPELAASRSAFQRFKDRVAPKRDGTSPLRQRANTIPTPEGALFDERTYSNEAGTRAYKLYVPGGFKGGPIPLVIMLHGCTQSPDDFAAGTRMNELAEGQTFLVAYPEQSRSANAQMCWNWFNVNDQRRDRGEPSLIAGITRQIMSDYPVDPELVFIAGLSAGGATAAIMSSAYPDLYAGVGVHSGLACGAARDMPSAFAAMRHGAPLSSINDNASRLRRPMRTIVFHGDADKTVHPVNGAQVVAQGRADADSSKTISRGVAPGGIAYTRTIHANANGDAVSEYWILHGAAHAWSGGSSAGSYTEPRGPDASREMIRFFLKQRDAGLR